MKKALREMIATILSTVQYNEVGRVPSLFRTALTFPLWMLAGFYSRTFKEQIELLRGPSYLSAFRYSETFGDEKVSLPDVEALIVVEGKDFDVLPSTINSLEFGSANRISKLSLVTPSRDVKAAKEVASKLGRQAPFEIEVVDEDLLFAEKFRSDLKAAFADRYGWVLQQLLTIQFVQASKALGVLVLDADTVLIRPRVWLTFEGRQPLLVSHEYHPSYYKFLSRFQISEYPPKQTHVTHHMMMQPEKLRSVLKKSGLMTVERVGLEAMLAKGLHSSSPVCLEFELYAQGIKKFFPESFELVKFCNVSIPWNGDTHELSSRIEAERSRRVFYSISFHSYLR